MTNVPPPQKDDSQKSGEPEKKPEPAEKPKVEPRRFLRRQMLSEDGEDFVPGRGRGRE